METIDPQTPTKSNTAIIPYVKPNWSAKEFEEIYEKYALWKSLPIVMIRKMDRAKINAEVGIDDDEILDLCEIHSQGEFAAKYQLSRFTLTDWNKKIAERDPLYEAKGWARHLAKNMIFSLYSHAIKKGDAFLYKLFFQIVSDWNEKQTVQHDFPQITEFNISIARPKINAPNTEKGK